MDLNHPFNPYRSFTITAAAGSGKTWLLSGRCLRLVAAGAQANEIICCTFTNKAADEMRARILDNAFALLHSPGEQGKFDRWMNTWAAAAGFPVPAPRPAAKTAAIILRQAGELRVSTIDALFFSLARRFAPELGLPPDAEITDAVAETELKEQAWRQFLQRLYRTPKLSTAYENYLRQTAGRGSIFSRDAMETLYRQRGELAAYGCTPTAAIDRLRLPEPDLAAADRDFAAALTAAFSAFTGTHAFSDNYRDRLDVFAAAGGDLARGVPPLEVLNKLHDAGVLNRLDSGPYGVPGQVKLNGSRFRKKAIKAALNAANASLESALRDYRALTLAAPYNRILAGLAGLYREYEEIRDIIKHQRRLLEFADLGRAALELWHDPRWEGIRYHLLSGVRHVLLDEFQDTSRLQWRVFHRLLADALLDGEGIYPDATLFIVGDEKQSIYAFRNADYRVLEDARAAAAHHPRVIHYPLNRSFRSSPPVLDFVNRVFATINDHHPNTIPFTPHERHPDAFPLSGGSVTLLPPVAYNDGGEERRTAADRRGEEAHGLAAACWRLLTETRPLIAESHNGAIIRRRVRPGDITILYRTKNGVDRLIAALKRHDIPLVRDDQGGFFRQPEIRDAMALVALLADPGNEIALLRLLRSPLAAGFDFSVTTLLEARLKGDRTPLLDRVLAVAPETPLGRGLAAAVTGGRELPPLARAARFLALSRAAERYPQAGGHSPADNLDRFLARLAENDYLSAIDAWRHLQRLRDEDELSPVTGGGNAVRLMTVHRAKGLQNHVIMLFNLAAGTDRDDGFTVNRGDSRDRFPLIFLPRGKDDLPPVDILDRLRDEHRTEAFKEEMRILYVALTRATQHLVISAGSRDKDGALPPPVDLIAAALADMNAAKTDLTGAPCYAGIFVPHVETGMATDEAGGGDETGGDTAAKRDSTGMPPIVIAPEPAIPVRRLRRASPSAFPRKTGLETGATSATGTAKSATGAEPESRITPKTTTGATAATAPEADAGITSESPETAAVPAGVEAAAAKETRNTPRHQTTAASDTGEMNASVTVAVAGGNHAADSDAALLGTIVHRFFAERLHGLEPSLHDICAGWAPIGQEEEYETKATALVAALEVAVRQAKIDPDGTFPEVGLAAITADGRYLAGRIDVLETAANEAAANQARGFDFKTGGIDQVQLAAYREILQQIFPGATVAPLHPDMAGEG